MEILFFAIPFMVLIGKLIWDQMKADEENCQIGGTHMAESKVTKVLDALQDWGWFIGILVFLGLIATVSICQGIDDFQYWKYLSAGWWFIVFYGASSVLFYLVTDKIKTIWRAKKQQSNMGQTTDGIEQIAERSEQTIGTRDMFLETLTKIGCQYELGEGQGENFTASANNEGWYVHIWDTHWGHVELYDIDEFARLKKAINLSNLNCATMTVYTIDEAGSNVDVHCKSIFPFIPQMPNLEGYLRNELGDFFTAHHMVSSEMAKLREQEENAQVN